MKDNKTEENNKYESLASYLDDRSVAPDGKVSPSEEEHLRKLVFMWDECHPPKAETEGVWTKTLQKIKENEAAHTKHRSGFMLAWTVGVAASIALLIGFTFFLSQGNGEQESEASKMEQFILANSSEEDVKEVTLVVSDKKKIEIANNSKVAYSPTGEVQVNSDKLHEAEATVEEEKEVMEYNQIIVPKGRRSMIVLADNSKIWINSGSKVIYPRAFSKGKREIFVEGEVYLKVAHNENKPFVVNTSSFEVEVLGTSFNVAAYKDNAEASVVLVEGAVNIKDCLERQVAMKPNERVELNKENGIAKKEEVNALEYIHWVDGVWVLNGKPLKEVILYLSEYYGQPIHCDTAIENEPFL
ncbi:MAG: FecR family protein [Bacteroides sp.]|nr:FecR family protein [Bacteroides sp.]